MATPMGQLAALPRGSPLHPPLAPLARRMCPVRQAGLGMVRRAEPPRLGSSSRRRRQPGVRNGGTRMN
eukprot:13278881-Alexandrium_andersonii.AAC.1